MALFKAIMCDKNLNSDVVVMKSAKNRVRFNHADYMDLGQDDHGSRPRSAPGAIYKVQATPPKATPDKAAIFFFHVTRSSAHSFAR